MSMGQGNNIVLADRSPLYRAGLKLALAGNPRVSFTEADSIAALIEQKVRAVPADLVIIDASLFQTGEKEQVIDFIATTAAPVLLLCHQVDLHGFRCARRLGARGLLAKTASMDEIQRAMQRLLTGGSVWPEVDKVATAQAPAEMTQQIFIERIRTLTPKEKLVLPYLRAGKLYKQIAYELDLRDATIKYHASNIQRKMRAKNRTHLISLLKKITPAHTHATPAATA